MGEDILAIASHIEPYVKSNTTVAMLIAEALVNLRMLTMCSVNDEVRKHLPSIVIRNSIALQEE